MRLAAYLLAGDPAWVADSVASYYDIVDVIVVSYDRTNTSWNGYDLQVPECLERIRTVDVAGKVVELAGDYSDPSRFTLDLETEQRQAALDHIGDGADWVLQLDSDEVMTAPGRFLECLQHAEDAGAHALDYPLRYLYQRTHDGRFLELTTRTWRPRAGFPGPAAVRAGTRLRHCRQADVPIYRVDIRHINSDPWRAADTRVDEVVAVAEANVHFWWVRTEEQMVQKARVSGHTDVYNSQEALAFWRWCAHHPRSAVLATIRRGNSQRWLRFAEVPLTLRSRDWYEAPPPPAGRAGRESAGRRGQA